MRTVALQVIVTTAQYAYIHIYIAQMYNDTTYSVIADLHTTKYILTLQLALYLHTYIRTYFTVPFNENVSFYCLFRFCCLTCV